jgi:hypothetical protein
MRFDRKRFLIAAAVCLVAAPVHAQSKTDPDSATNELSSEMVECGQYFLLSWVCFKDMPNPEAEAVANNYRAASDQINQLAFQVVRSVGLTERAHAARMKMANDSLMKEINKSCVNFSILQERYATFCKNLLQHPDQRYRDLVQCSANKRAFPCGDH